MFHRAAFAALLSLGGASCAFAGWGWHGHQHLRSHGFGVTPQVFGVAPQAVGVVPQFVMPSQVPIVQFQQPTPLVIGVPGGDGGGDDPFSQASVSADEQANLQQQVELLREIRDVLKAIAAAKCSGTPVPNAPALGVGSDPFAPAGATGGTVATPGSVATAQAALDAERRRMLLVNLQSLEAAYKAAVAENDPEVAKIWSDRIARLKQENQLP